MKKFYYIVYLEYITVDSYSTRQIFITDNEFTAVFYVQRFNKLVKKQKEKLKNFEPKYNNQELPFWYNYIMWDGMKADLDKIEYRY